MAEQPSSSRKPIKVAHFSFANAQRDGQMKCSPKERLDAIYQFFEWAALNDITVIGCTEGHRVQNEMNWPEFEKHLFEHWRYRLLSSACLGDKSKMSFASQLYLRMDETDRPPFTCDWEDVVTLSPPELEGTRWVVRAPIRSIEGVCKLMYCHLSLSRDGRDPAYDHLVHELRLLRDYVSDGWIAFGDFNLTQETRARLDNEQPELMAKLQFQFGRQISDTSFITFPHDRVPKTAFINAPDAILDENEAGCNCVAPLDAVCGIGVTECRRFLPWKPFVDVPLGHSVEQVVRSLKHDNQPPANICDWASDHWILSFSV